eukprot:7384708-Prymnesium_polylepis.1
MRAEKSKLSDAMRIAAESAEFQSNHGDELNVLFEAAKLLNCAEFEGGGVVNIGFRTSTASTYKGSNCRPNGSNDRRRTSKSKASDAITQAAMVLNCKHLVLEGKRNGHATALRVLKAIAREADVVVHVLQYSRPTRREYVIPIYNLDAWIK